MRKNKGIWENTRGNELVIKTIQRQVSKSYIHYNKD